MKKIQTLLLLIVFVAGATNIFAQKEFKKGTVTMEITKIDAKNPQVASMMKMMEGSETKTYFTEDQTLVIADMMGGMVKNRTLVNNETKETLLLMDAMGQKIMSKISAEEAKKMKEETKEVKPKITYDKEDKKIILDYDCYRADIEIETNGQKVNMVAYVTDQIKMGSSLIQGVDADAMTATPLEYVISMSQQGMEFSMTFTAKELLDHIKNMDIFKLDTTGYNEMTIDQLKQMGGGGMGF